MKFPLPRPLFPDLEVAPSDEESLVALVDTFVDKFIAEEHTFRVTNGGLVDATRWKSLRSAENAVVYRERSSAASASPAKSATEKQATHKLVPPFLVVGEVPGSLDELLYGFSAPTREATLIKASYVDDSVADADVLHNIRRPTPEEPFSHITIKWFVIAMRSALVAPRDFVYLDVIGTRVLPNGERIGYRFAHSIKLKGAEPMADKGFLRSNFSLCTIFREAPADNSSNGAHVQVYGRAFHELRGAIPRSLYTFVVSLQVSSAAAQQRNGQLKKLALAVRRAAAHRRTVAVPPPVAASEMENRCGVCLKALHLLNKSGSECALCARRLCFACRVRKTLSFLDREASISRWRVAFCSFCLQQAIHMPSRLAATEEFLQSGSGGEEGEVGGFYREPETLSASAAATPASTLRHFFSST